MSKANVNYGDVVLSKRTQLGMNQREFAEFIGIGESGDRTIRGWESGDHIPSQAKLKVISSLPDTTPFRTNDHTSTFTFIDLFAGIGGIRLPFQELGGKCVFTSEWDKHAKKTYAANFGEVPRGDITQIPADNIPDHDVLLAGFPCQAFSQAGLKKGFHDTRGTMFFEIQRILAAKRPKAFLLENVKQLRGHDKGNTLKTIVEVLEGKHVDNIDLSVPMSNESRRALSRTLNYSVGYKVLRAADFGVPQNRERIFIVGFDRDHFDQFTANRFDDIFEWPDPLLTTTRVGSILEENSAISDRYTISQRLWDGHQRRKKEHKEKGNGFGYSLFNIDSPYTNTISARYYKDGSEILIDQSGIGKLPRKLTPRECARLQGFPDQYIVNAVSDTQAYRQFGNSVSVPVVRAVAEQMIKTMMPLNEQYSNMTDCA